MFLIFLTFTVLVAIWGYAPSPLPLLRRLARRRPRSTAARCGITPLYLPSARHRRAA